MHQNIEDSVRDQIFERLRELPENNKCFDCDSKKPKWASVNLGLFLCMDCAGKHREYGANYSFVRSLTLDSWSQKQILFMENGGNKQAIEFWRKIGAISEANPKPDYKSANAQKYKQELERKVEPILRELNKKNAPEPEKKEEKIINPVVNNVSNNQPEQNKPTLAQKSPIVPQDNKNDIDFFSIKNTNNVEIVSNPIDFKNNKKPAAAWGATGNNKGKPQGKKITDFDFNDLKIEDNSFNNNKSAANKMDAPVFQNFETKATTSSSEKPSYSSNTGFSSNSFASSGTSENQEKLQKLKHDNVKAISSRNFFNDAEETNEARQNLTKFNNASAISSAQLFGEEDPNQINHSGGGPEFKDNFKNFMENAGTAAKNITGKAGQYFSKLKQGWH